MEEKGYIVCLLKYMIGHGTRNSQQWDDISGNRKPISLGYFGRVDVAPVTRFKEYMDLASTHHAEFMGSRKQLLLYPLDAEGKSQLKLRPDSGEENRLPFQPSGGGDPCFCCLSVLNINQSVKDVVCSSDYSNGIRKIAGLVAGKIEQSAVDKAGNRQLFYAVMGLLGTEDLCVITLSDRFETITGAINGMRGLVLVNEQTAPDMPVVENSHSILMVDFSDQADKPDWGSAKAEIHFSLKTAMGLSYLNEIRGMIEGHAGGHPVVLENRVGKYDAVIRCPASALGAYLYGYNGAVNYRNKIYRKIAYQSETILYTQDSSPFPRDFTGKDFSEKEESDKDRMKLHVERAVRAINTSILDNEEDLQGDYRIYQAGAVPPAQRLYADHGNSLRPSVPEGSPGTV